MCATELAGTEQPRRDGASTCFPLFAIKNRCKISLYKYSREMQRCGPHPLQRTLLQWSREHLERQSYEERACARIHTPASESAAVLCGGSAEHVAARGPLGLQLDLTCWCFIDVLIQNTFNFPFNANMPNCLLDV